MPPQNTVLYNWHATTSNNFQVIATMPPVWSHPSRISPRLQFLFENAPPADPNKVINVTCDGPHVENVSAGTKKPAEYGQWFVFISISYLYPWSDYVDNDLQCIHKQCAVWKHWLHDPLTPLEQAELCQKECEWKLGVARESKLVECMYLATLLW